MRRSTSQWKKGVFSSEKGGGNSVNQGFGKDFYQRGNSVKRSGPFSEPPDSENWKVAVLIPFPKISSYYMLVLLKAQLGEPFLGILIFFLCFFHHVFGKTGSYPKGPKIEKIQDRPPGLKFSIEIEIFKRATHQTPIFVGGFWRSGIEIFNRDWKFQSRLKISIEIDFFQSLDP